MAFSGEMNSHVNRLLAIHFILPRYWFFNLIRENKWDDDINKFNVTFDKASLKLSINDHLEFDRNFKNIYLSELHLKKGKYFNFEASFFTFLL